MSPDDLYKLVAEVGFWRIRPRSTTIGKPTRLRDWLVVQWSEENTLIYGWTEEEALHKPLQTIPAGKCEEEFEEAIQQLSSGVKKRVQQTTTRITKSGQLIKVIATLLPVREDGKLVEILGSVTDITARLKVEEALQKEQRWSEALFNAFPLAVIVIDEQGVMTRVNSNCCEMFGYTDSELLGERVEILLPQYLREVHERHRADYSKNPVVRQMGKGFGELFGQSKSGSQIPLEISIFPIVDNGQRQFAAVIVNVAQRTKLLEQLLHSQKMEAVGRMTGGVIHDINNLLTVMIGYANMVAAYFKDVSPEPEESEYCKQILDAGGRAAALTTQMLAFSRQTLMSRKVINAGKLVQSMQEMLRKIIPENIKITYNIADDLGNLGGDSNNIEQVLMNLILNARDAMPNGGTINIKTENFTVLEEVSFGTYCEIPVGSYVCISVRDTGTGMSAEVKKHLFEPYFTTKPAGKGSGFGLSIVHSIISQHKGHITIYSEQNLGTTVKVYFPRTDEVATADLESSRPANFRGTETILIAEDEEAVRKLLGLQLGREGYTVLAASGGEEALKIAKQHQGPIHVLISDVRMTGMSGPDTYLAFRELMPNTPVIFISGYSSGEMRTDGWEWTRHPFIEKPFNAQQLLRKIRECLDAKKTSESSSGKN